MCGFMASCVALPASRGQDQIGPTGPPAPGPLVDGVACGYFGKKNRIGSSCSCLLQYPRGSPQDRGLTAPLCRAQKPTSFAAALFARV